MGEIVTSWQPSLSLTRGERQSRSSERRNVITILYCNHAMLAV